MFGSKRKAEHDLAGPPAQRSCLSSGSLSATSPRRKVGGFVQPSSIQAIIRDNSRKRLYVPPIAWTSEHLQLLACSFSLQKCSKTTRRRSQPSSRDRSPSNARENGEDVTAKRKRSEEFHDYIRAATQLARRSTLLVKKLAVEEILAAYDIRPLGPEKLSFYFGHQPVADVLTDSFFSDGSGPPNVAYITFDRIRELHKKDLTLLSLKIKSKTHNIVTMLIALAQAHQRHQQQQGECIKRTVDNQMEEAEYICRTGCCAADYSSAVSRQRSDDPEVRPFFSRFMSSLFLAQQPGYSMFIQLAFLPDFLDKFDEPSHFLPSCPVAVMYRYIPLTMPEAV